MERIFEILFDLGNGWIQTQLDAVSFLIKCIKKQRSQTNPRIRESKVNHDPSICNVYEVQISLDKCHRILSGTQDVHLMFQKMGLSREQTDMIFTIIMTNPSIQKQDLQEIVSLYKRAEMLKPFSTDQSLIDNHMIKSQMKEIRILFLSHIQNMLPLTKETEQLEKAITDVILQKNLEDVRTGVIQASGCECENTIDIQSTQKGKEKHNPKPLTHHPKKKALYA